jgi:hypothetical protein
MTNNQPQHATFIARWEHHVREDGYCGCKITEFEIDSDNHAFFHLLEHMVETLPGMDQVILMMAQKIVQEQAMKGDSDVTKN